MEMSKFLFAIYFTISFTAEMVRTTPCPFNSQCVCWKDPKSLKTNVVSMVDCYKVLAMPAFKSSIYNKIETYLSISGNLAMIPTNAFEAFWEI